MPIEQADRLFKHPMTQDAFRWVTDFVVDLRQSRS
jgi:hypothetical protein